MARYRVYEVARDFDLSSEALVNLLHEMGVSVTCHMSCIDEGAVEKVRDKSTREQASRKASEDT